MCVFVEDVWSSKIIVLRKGMRCQKTTKKKKTPWQNRKNKSSRKYSTEHSCVIESKFNLCKSQHSIYISQ